MNLKKFERFTKLILIVFIQEKLKKKQIMQITPAH